MKLSAEQRRAAEARLQEIANSNDGRLTPDDVIEDAKQKTSPLHGLFEWDIKRAAYQYWREQARTLISSVTIIVRTTRTEIVSPCYIRDPNARSHEQGYVAIEKLRTQEDSARAALIDEFKRAGDILQRAKIIAIALDMQDDVDRIVGGILDLRMKLEQLQPPGIM